MDAVVRFANAQYYDVDDGVVWFTAFAQSHVIPCAIRVRALQEFFHGSPHSPLACFCRWRHPIEQVAAALMAEERFADDGSIRIDSEDCQRLNQGRIATAIRMLEEVRH